MEIGEFLGLLGSTTWKFDGNKIRDEKTSRCPICVVCESIVGESLGVGNVIVAACMINIPIDDAYVIAMAADGYDPVRVDPVLVKETRVKLINACRLEESIVS